MGRTVAFKGSKGHGKTTAARVLEEAGYAHINFGDPLKRVCATVFGLTEAEMNDPVLKETALDRWPFFTPRHIMQHVGTELFRNWLPEVWTKAWSREASVHDKVTCSDVRFQNEADTVRDFEERRGGHAWLVEVFNPNKPFGVDLHVSETEMGGIEVDVHLRNDGSIADLHAQTRYVFLETTPE